MKKGQYMILFASLEKLGLPYQAQVKTLPEFVDVMDEILSDFDNAFHLVAQLMDENMIPYKSVNEILHCYFLIELNMSVPEKTTDESFEFDECWKMVRDYANSALSRMKAL